MVARQAPGGTRMDDGFSTLIALTGDPDISFWEKTVKPPGIDGGDAIETTTMHNVDWRSMAPRALKTLTDSDLTVAYDPAVYDQIVLQINVNQLITVHFPDGSELDFWGFLRVFEPQDNEEGSQPEATINLTPTNIDAAGDEIAPNYKGPAS